jgi:WD40 repeat protein
MLLIGNIAFVDHGESWVVGSGSSVRLYDSVSGAVLRTIDLTLQNLKNPREVSIAAEGSLVAIPTDDGIYVWDMKDGMIRHRLKDVPTSVYTNCVVFSMDGALLASSSDDHIVRIWDTHLGVCLHNLEGHTSSIEYLTFSPDSRKLASLALSSGLCIWNVDHGSLEVRQTINPRFVDGHIKFSPDGKMLAYANGVDATLLNFITGRSANLHAAGISFDFAPDNAKLASGSDCGYLQIWDTSTGKEIRKVEAYQSPVSSVLFARNGNVLVSLAQDEWTVDIWDVAKLERISTLDHAHPVLDFDVSATALITFSEMGMAKLWDLASIVIPPKLPERPFRFEKCFLSPSGNLVAANSDLDQYRMIFDVVTGQANKLAWSAPATHAWPIFSPDERFVAFFTRDYGLPCDAALQVWNIASCQLVHSITYQDKDLFSGNLLGFQIAVYESDPVPPMKPSIGAPLWDMVSQESAPLSLHKTPSLGWQATSHHGETVTLDRDGFFHLQSIINLCDGSALRDVETQDLVTTIFCAPKSLIAQQFVSGLFEVVSVKTGQLLWRSNPGAAGDTYILDFSSSGDMLAVSYNTGKLVLFDPMTSDILYNIDLDVSLNLTTDTYCPSFSCFAAEGSGVHLTNGFLSFISKKFTKCSLLKPTAQARPTVFFNDDWLYIDDKPRLWLPEQYRTDDVTVSKNVIFAVHENGSSSIWQLHL